MNNNQGHVVQLEAMPSDDESAAQLVVNVIREHGGVNPRSMAQIMMFAWDPGWLQERIEELFRRVSAELR